MNHYLAERGTTTVDWTGMSLGDRQDGAREMETDDWSGSVITGTRAGEVWKCPAEARTGKVGMDGCWSSTPLLGLPRS